MDINDILNAHIHEGANDPKSDRCTVCGRDLREAIHLGAGESRHSRIREELVRQQGVIAKLCTILELRAAAHDAEFASSRHEDDREIAKFCRAAVAQADK